MVKYYYVAERAGTYNVTLYYRSGSISNSLSWSSEPEGAIVKGQHSAGASHVSTVRNVTFTVEITEPGSGYWVFTGPSGNSPQIDYMEITPLDITLEQYTVTANAGEGGAISDAGETTLTEGDSKTYTITPSSGYRIADIIVNGKSMGAISQYTVSEISEDVEIEAVFQLVNYTEENRFAFPTNVDADPVTLEAEHFILNNTAADNERFKLKIVKSDWASNGEFVNSLNANDTICVPYTAVAGIYEVTATYRSGSASKV